jgi:putative oxidoreductase
MSVLFSAAPIAGRPGLGLAILRVVVGIIFVAHGAQKFFQFGIPGVVSGFAQMGIPMPGIVAPLIAGLELGGGALLILGLLTPLVALLLAADMLGAILLVHLRAGFFLPNGYEFALILLAACLTLALAGPGTAAVDNALFERRRTASL